MEVPPLSVLEEGLVVHSYGHSAHQVPAVSASPPHPSVPHLTRFLKTFDGCELTPTNHWPAAGPSERSLRFATLELQVLASNKRTQALGCATQLSLLFSSRLWV